MPFNFFVSFLVESALITTALKCFECFSKEECIINSHMVECNHASVQLASNHFNFLPNVMSQLPSDEFYCADYEGLKYNTTELTLKGCFYSTFNPCAFLPTSDSNMKIDSGYRCKYCNLFDGCNSGTRKIYQTKFWIVILGTVVVLSGSINEWKINVL